MLFGDCPLCNTLEPRDRICLLAVQTKYCHLFLVKLFRHQTAWLRWLQGSRRKTKIWQRCNRLKKAGEAAAAAGQFFCRHEVKELESKAKQGSAAGFQIGLLLNVSCFFKSKTILFVSGVVVFLHLRDPETKRIRNLSFCVFTLWGEF